MSLPVPFSRNGHFLSPHNHHGQRHMSKYGPAFQQQLTVPGWTTPLPPSLTNDTLSLSVETKIIDSFLSDEESSKRIRYCIGLDSSEKQHH